MANLSIEKQKDFRVIATICIWVSSIFLLLACVPILALTENGILLPLTLLIAVATGTVAIWCFGKPKSSENDKNLQALQSRIENLEAIAGIMDFDKKLIE